MEMLTANRGQITSLLSNEVLARVEQLRINSTRRFTNRSRGEHLSGKGGQSTEFADYRNYVEGDDIRYVDWNIFSRLHKPFLKIFHQEEEMHVVLFVDASSSMIFEDKLAKAKQLAAAFGVMGLFNVERVSAFAFNQIDGQLPRLPPCTGRGNMPSLFAFLESIEGGGDAALDDAVDALLKRHRGRGVIVMLSDFLTYDDVSRPLNKLFSAGLEIFAIQVLGPTEIDPDVTGDLRFVDCETASTLDVSSAGNLVNIYQEYRLAYERNLEQLCRGRGGRFMPVSADDPIESLLFDRLRRIGWVV